ncbi:MAG: NAD+ synthase, partial [Rhodoluna sp.]
LVVVSNLRLALAQTNPTVGDLSGNLGQIIAQIKLAVQSEADLICFGEMALTGYPIEDLASRVSFLSETEHVLDDLRKELEQDTYGKITVVIGHPMLAPEGLRTGWAIAQNRATVIRGGEIIGSYSKHHLPNYSVFDEYRIFVPGNDLLTFAVNNFRISTVICEDILQSGGPVAQLNQAKTDLCLILNGSPFEIDKDDRRLSLVSALATKHDCAAAYVNLVGGQDDLVFDGDSIVVNNSGKLVARMKQFKEDLMILDFTSKDSVRVVGEHFISKPNDNWQAWNALVLGLRDYVAKNGFKSVVLGLSGGIDSAVCATIAADAIGAKNVFGVSMPSRYSSTGSKDDASELASRRGINYQVQPIEDLVLPFENQLELSGLAAENLQARVRGVILMGLSNMHGMLTLTTGNKTELAVGYSTIYGDTVGGYAPLKDVEKTLVWELARWRNEYARTRGEIEPIPVSSIEKPPSAELRPDQLDQDSLPPYDILDQVLELYVNLRRSIPEIVSLGFDKSMVERIIQLVDRAEWKRRQGAIGPKITGMAFGRDRRLPITNRFSG